MAARAFLGLGSNVDDPPRHVGAAIAALDRGPIRVAAAGRLVRGPYEGAAEAAPVLNTVVEVRTTLPPHALLERLQALEGEAGRQRSEPTHRTLDLDLLAYEDLVLSDDRLTVPHPRCLGRAFVLEPWAEVAPRFVVPACAATGAAATVVEHAATLRRDRPEAFEDLEVVSHASFGPREGAGVVLEDRAALRDWRRAQAGRVGVVPTMGALHPGHAALVQRAAAECDAVVATLFVNPLQFGAGEDLARYPRTFDADCALLRHHGAAAVYAPAPDDLYPPDFATYVQPEGAAHGYEGAQRPTHFRGVATVVHKLWTRIRPDRIYFGRKDAQQLAVLGQMARDMDLDGDVVGCPTVRDLDGLALSSRNRYLDAEQRAAALGLPRGLETMVRHAAAGQTDCTALCERARDVMVGSGLEVDYVDVVEAGRMTPRTKLEGAALGVAAVRLGSVRLLDNRWVAPPLKRAEPAVPSAGRSESPES